MYCFFRIINKAVVLTDIINHLYDENQLNVSIMNLNTFAN